MNSPRREKVDAVIVGCGVAGGMLACYLAEAGYETIVLEKRPTVGVPIRCAEGAGSRNEIAHFIPLDEAWIQSDINGIELVSPGGRVLEKRMPGVAVVLRRDLFDQALAARAVRFGADVRTNNEVVGLSMEDGRIQGVEIQDHSRGTTYTIGARVTVGADGIESFVGRWAGLRRHLKLSEIHSCYQYLMKWEGFPADTIHLYLGSRIAPGGYAWVFPRGRGRANVGLGLHPEKGGGKTPKEYLDDFVRERFPHAEVEAVVAGGTSGVKPLGSMVTHGLLLVGEAAGQNNPFSGGGIMNALEGAEEAARVLVEALRDGDLSAGRLKEYDRNWNERNGRVIEKFAALRRFFFDLSDKDMDNIVDILNDMTLGLDLDGIDYTDIFKAAFLAAPGLLWKARKLLW